MRRILLLAFLAGLAPAAAAQVAAPFKLDAWAPISNSGDPTARFGAAGVFTRIDGTDHMMIFGGGDLPILPLTNTGGLWRRRDNTWSATTTTGAPNGRAWPSIVWTGHEVIVWGGDEFSGFGFLQTGGKYNPVANAWTATSETLAAGGRVFHSALWTGERMIVWGGRVTSIDRTDTGALYDPIADSWSATSLTGAPSARSDHSAVWTGERMLVWGGFGISTYVGDGAIYDPYSDTWSAMSSVNAPSPRSRQVTGWDGSHMFVWGGQDTNGVLADGKVYGVATDTWSNVSTIGAPSARTTATVVYDGQRFLVWGGANVSAPLGTGARYNRLNDSWTPITTWGAPSPRYSHVAVWDGARMIVWGGLGAGIDNFLGDGFAYTP